MKRIKEGEHKAERSEGLNKIQNSFQLFFKEKIVEKCSAKNTDVP